MSNYKHCKNPQHAPYNLQTQMVSHYTSMPCYMPGYMGVYGNGYDSLGYGNVYGYGNQVGYMYGHAKGITSYQQNVEPKTRSSAPIPLLSGRQNKAKDEKIAELKVELKTERGKKARQEAQLKALLKYNKDLLTEKKELVAENSKLSDALAEMKITQSVDLEDIRKLKQKVEKLEDDLNNLDDRLHKARANANALNVVNEMLLKGNKERDEIIAQYKKKLGSSSDRDSMLDGHSSVQVAARETNRCETHERRLGSKALHALTALGAENTMGPWLCIPCGSKGCPIRFPSYPEFRRHLIEVHKKTIDPSLCALCGWHCVTPSQMDAHLQTNH